MMEWKQGLLHPSIIPFSMLRCLHSSRRHTKLQLHSESTQPVLRRSLSRFLSLSLTGLIYITYDKGKPIKIMLHCRTPIIVAAASSVQSISFCKLLVSSCFLTNIHTQHSAQNIISFQPTSQHRVRFYFFPANTLIAHVFFVWVDVWLHVFDSLSFLRVFS